MSSTAAVVHVLTGHLIDMLNSTKTASIWNALCYLVNFCIVAVSSKKDTLHSIFAVLYWCSLGSTGMSPQRHVDLQQATLLVVHHPLQNGTSCCFSQKLQLVNFASESVL